MEQITIEKLLEMFGPQPGNKRPRGPKKAEGFDKFQAAAQKAVERIQELWAEVATTGFVIFENTNLDSSHLGERTAVVVGPEHTYKSIDAYEGKWLNDLPSQRQYARYFVLKEAPPNEDSQEDSV